MTDDRLRAAYQRRLSERAARTAECMEPEQLLAVVEGTSGDAERLRTLRHVGGCAFCRADLELLRSARDAAGQAAARPLWQRTGWLAAAASVIVFAGALVMWQVTRGPVADVPRSSGSSRVVLHAPADAGASARPVRLVWGAFPGALRYEVEVVHPNGSLAYAAVTSDTTVIVPVTAPLEAGIDYRWWVEAVLPGQTARSLTRRLRITP